MGLQDLQPCVYFLRIYIYTVFFFHFSQVSLMQLTIKLKKNIALRYTTIQPFRILFAVSYCIVKKNKQDIFLSLSHFEIVQM